MAVALELDELDLVIPDVTPVDLGLVPLKC